MKEDNKDEENKIVELDGIEFLFNDDDLLIIENLKKELENKSGDNNDDSKKT